MMRPPASSVPLAVLSVIALVMLFGRAAGTDNDAAPVVEPVARERAAAAPARADPLQLVAIARPKRPGDDVVVDLFPGRSWTPPPAPPAPVAAAPAPPPPPTAPALPYAYVGRVEAPDEKAVVYLARGDRMLTATEGDVLDQVYRVESLGESEIVFTYIPLAQKQVLRIDAAGK